MDKKPLLDAYYYATPVPDGIEDIAERGLLEEALEKDYQLKFRPRTAPRGGGFYELFANLFSLQGIVSLVVTGVAYDLRKSAVTPLLNAVINHRSKHGRLDIAELKINLSDVTIRLEKFGHCDFSSMIPGILETLAGNIGQMVLDGEFPEAISGPICRDVDRNSDSGAPVFREYRDVDDYYVMDGLVEYGDCYRVYYALKDKECIYSIWDQKIYETDALSGSDSDDFIGRNVDRYFGSRLQGSDSPDVEAS